MLMQSITGLVNLACAEGRTPIGIWVPAGGRAYDTEKEGIGTRLGSLSAKELALGTFAKQNGINPTVKTLFDGYVLTDLVNNPESGNAAAVASHVYNSIIVDVRDEDFFKRNGYTLKCDCSKMTLRQAFDQFKDKCNNNALVLMPAGCGELRDYAITHRLFVMNINKQYGSTAQGQNWGLLEDVLEWLEPGSQVIGWEQGIPEIDFVRRISSHGHLMLAADWSYNLALTSRHYSDRQSAALAKTINPRDIDYDETADWCSFFLTDGDNYQFIITDNFEDNYYCLPSAARTKTAFELGSQSLIQLAPSRFDYLLEKQPSPECTIMETFGGGYFYIDNFATAGKAAADRPARMKQIAERTAAHMRQHGIKVLHVMAKDLNSEAGKQMLQAFVDANDQLEGITAVQYSPYVGGKGNVMWFTNKAGYDIPCITAKYMLWDGLSSPAQVSSAINASSKAGTPGFNPIVIHAWSSFSGKQASDAAELCAGGLNESCRLISMQEMIWRIRMYKNREQTRKYLSTIK